jgi:hypothetical protein
MSKFEKELRVRIARDGTKSAADWYIRAVANQPVNDEEFSPFELEFCSHIEASYRRWLDDPRWLDMRTRH